MASEPGEASALYSSLVKWLENCLALGGTLTFDPSAVSDGNAIADCLVQLAPDFFTSTWRGKIISETAGNWKLRHNNLKKIQRSVMDYYKQVLHISLEKFSQPDLTKIAESGSHDDMSRLIQLVLGIAINCEHKDTYIQAIMSMQQEVQHVVMGAIQDLMSYQAPAMVAGDDYQVLEDEHKQVVSELQKLRVEREQLLQQNHEYQAQVKVTQEEVGDLSSEVELLKGKLKEAQTSAGITGESKAIQLQRQLDQVKSEKFRTEAERDELKHKAEEADAQVRELYQKCRELAQENQEIPILRDSLEEMKYLQSKVKNYESVISQYKKKLEDAQELRKKVKAMEDKNMMYMQQNMDLEEELRRLSGARMQIETQKQKLQELENLLAQERLHSLEASQDSEEKQQALESLRAELAQVKRERDSLHMQVPGTPVSGEFPMFPPAPGGRQRAPFESSGSFEQPDLGGGVGGLGLEEAFTPELRERMARLEKENEIMRRRLDSNIKESIEPSLLVGSSKDEDVLRRKVAEQLVTIERLERDKKDSNDKLTRLETRLKKFENEVASLEEVKKTKDAEIEKYKKYLSKAKKIIESFGGSAKSAPEDALEIQALKNQLKEKEKNIERIEREYGQDRLAWEREEKLVVSAWYELGLKMHRKYSNERLVNQFGSSFLSQQRQSLYKRPVAINTSMASSASPASSSGDV